MHQYPRLTVSTKLLDLSQRPITHSHQLRFLSPNRTTHTHHLQKTLIHFLVRWPLMLSALRPGGHPKTLLCQCVLVFAPGLMSPQFIPWNVCVIGEVPFCASPSPWKWKGRPEGVLAHISPSARLMPPGLPRKVISTARNVPETKTSP